jgi:hypothetical protein
MAKKQKGVVGIVGLGIMGGLSRTIFTPPAGGSLATTPIASVGARLAASASRSPPMSARSPSRRP